MSNWVLTAGGVIAQIDKAFCTDWSVSVSVRSKLLCRRMGPNIAHRYIRVSVYMRTIT